MTAEQDSHIGDVETPDAEADEPAAGMDTRDAVDDRSGYDKSGERTTTRRPRLGVSTGWLRRCLVLWRSILLGLLILGATAVAACVFFLQYRPYHQTTDAAARDAIKAASEGSVALLSYAPDTLEHDLVNAKSHLTGEFLGYYDKFTRQIVTPAAKEHHVQTTAVVARAALLELHPNSAVVLTFIDQTTMSKDKPEPIVAASAVRVGLTKTDGRWLISAFDPV
ncbi:MAG: twin-arginine translocation pathway signal [Mycobacterium sp.]|nr:twin-arginine translocation pathway signal [Mycobacterium sp.]